MAKPLPRVLSATAIVVLVPAAVIWTLRATGTVSSPALGAALGALLSLGVYQLGAECWQRRADTSDVLFGDLMLWGWVRRCRQQRRIADAGSLLDGTRARELTPASRSQLLRRLATDLEARDPYTLGHSRRVARYSALVAQRLGASAPELARIRTAAALHDIGKLNTPLDVLRKPSALTDAEYELIKRHPGDGAALVAILEDPAVTEIVLRHHERLDGSGYPDGCRAEQVPLGARIIAVVDTFDAITSARPYRAAKPHRMALEILREEAGSKLDAEVVDAFVASYHARRPLGIWIIVTELVDQLPGWIGGGLVSSGARLAAVAAGTIAAGAGTFLLPAVGISATTPTGSSATHHRSGVIAERAPAAGARTTNASRQHAGQTRRAATARTGSDRGGRGSHSRSRSSSRAQPATGGNRAPAPGGSGGPIASPAGAPGDAGGGTGGSGTGGGGKNGSGGRGSAGGAHGGSGSGGRRGISAGATVGGGAGPSAGVSVGVGGSGASVGAGASGGSGSAPVSAGVSAGSSGVGVTATVGGTGVGVTVGSGGTTVGLGGLGVSLGG